MGELGLDGEVRIGPAPLAVRRGAPAISCVICTNPRSGSWLLAEGLASTKVAGNPREWFHHSEEERERGRIGALSPLDITYEDYVEWIWKVGSTPNNIFGIKLHYYQFAELIAKMADAETLRGLPTAALMSAIFPNTRYVWLTRRDKARQALSYYRASKTDQWWRLKDAGATPAKQAVLDLAGVARMEKLLLDNDAQWRRYFRENAIEPYVITYEDLAADYDGAIVSLMAWLGVKDAKTVEIPPTRLTRQSDASTEAWLAAYMRYRSGASEPGVRPWAEVIGDSADNRPAIGAGPSRGVAAPSRAVAVARPPHGDLPDAWKTWIGANRLRGVTETSMIDIITSKGFDREVAAAEVARSARDPYLLAAEESQRRLNKALAVLGVLENLQALHQHAGTVERRSNVPRREFIDHYYALNRPVLLQGMMNDWPAMTLWTPEYLKARIGDQIVEVMTDRNADPNYERNSAKHRQKIPFGDYVDKVYSGEVTNEYYMVANNGFFQRPGVRALLEDIRVFPEYLNGDRREGIFFWFGPAGAVTPLHHDTSNIFMAQVSGRKRVKMAPANQWRRLYNSVGVFSDVDPENPDYDRWPEFRGATLIDVVLEPGEVLFMPVGWWHHVRSLEPSIMISFTNFAFPNHFKWPS